MKKVWTMVLSCMLVLGLTGGTVLAKNDKGGQPPGQAKKTEAGKQNKTADKAEHPSDNKPSEVKNAKEAGKENGKEKQSKEKQSKEKASKEDAKNKAPGNNGDKVTVTEDTYKKVPRGLLHALENVKDKPAGPVIAQNLLTKYGAQLSEETKQKLEAIVDPASALSEAAEILDQQGSVTEAVYVQKEAIQVNMRDLEGYKKLGKYYKKLGKKGINVFVNGEEVTSSVSPAVKEGNTLIPFRTIAEALEAEVVWNPKDKTITVTKDGTTIKLVLGSKTAWVNGVKKQLDVSPEVVNGSTLIPTRFVSESIGADVKWESESQTVVVLDQKSQTE
ncbi:copper amine oxidase N-terminal domain-containing protein [Paenibacillus sp. DYY-L-2]|uniref:copper amine oxidase N-terminal domain-containing protein n=1 Tax=Paenibacillus sp. DYY-L-2 TaxID=3447013 RepID=UPI003F5065F0